MECPGCGNSDLLPRFKCCPECGSLLAHGQNSPLREQKTVPAVSGEQPNGDGTANTHDTGTSKEQVEGKISV